MIKTVYTTNAPDAIGPYSQAKIAGGFLFASGQIAINPASGAVEADTIEGQTEQIMKNIAAILAEAGLTFDSVVKTTCFLKNMRAFLRRRRTAPQGRSGGSRDYRCLRVILS